jgi:hypothetical protein
VLAIQAITNTVEGFFEFRCGQNYRITERKDKAHALVVKNDKATARAESLIRRLHTELVTAVGKALVPVV